MWFTNLSGNKATAYQFYIAGAAAIFLGLYSFSLPPCKPERSKMMILLGFLLLD
jgi:NHS family xanthosine MFS transporter